jgi:tetratricopeptide (TPR) repeat protein
MGRLGSHPHIVTVYDIGEEQQATGNQQRGQTQPYLVLPVLPGGDVEDVIEKAPEHNLPIEQALKIATETCLGLEFSHAKGIIHRDLKPGNVWLAEDGRAMIGDFGLAVAVDRSRLTQAGMMVGTVSYMPPEQAMGGEVTPQSDLYSLGAMLYEMVCGRPPFVGDESVAIIGQHLNTPPVAPSWHRPDCPPGLEALILRLLEKDPSKRPASAAEVREALQAIGQSGNPAAVSEIVRPEPVEGRVVVDPLYRRTFVGRENETRQLHQAYDAAVSGQGGLVMVVGEPGIGKTALCEQLATYVQLRGGKTLVGHCYEEGSLSLPYLAFVEAMRSYVLARDPEGLRSDLGTGAAEVARIVSEVRDRVPVELRDATDPEDDRWRLLNAVSTFLRNAASVQPLVIVLEDLHWSDRGTLDLLLHVARNLEGARLLIVGTYRDVEVDRTHPLSATLADLRRIGTFLRIPLRGLTVDEVHRMYEAIRGNSVPWAQAELVHRQTEGNPLFVQEVLRYLVEEGIVVREGGQYVAPEGPGVGIPEGLRDVVGKRLSRLSEKTNQILSIAAVIGREFRLDVLVQVAGLAEEDLVSALEEATGRAIVEQQAGFGFQLTFRFTHAFFRQTLYEELFAARRIRIHQQVARALETTYGQRVQEHASELAEHFANSSDPADLEKSVQYSQMAAQRAMAVFAYAEAVRHYEQALKAQDVLDPDDREKRCDLLLALGETLKPTDMYERLKEQVAPEAFDLGLALGDNHRAFKACMLVLDVGIGTTVGQITNTAEFDLWRQRAGSVAEPGTSEQAMSDIYAAAVIRSVNPPEAWRLQKNAYELALKLRDEKSLSITASMTLGGFNTPAQDYMAVQQTFDDLDNADFHDSGSLTWGARLATLTQSALQVGRRDRAEAMTRDLRKAADLTHHPELDSYAAQCEALMATIEGNLEGVLEDADAFEDRQRAASRTGGGPVGRMRRRALMYLGRFEEALHTLPSSRDLMSVGGAIEGQRAIIFALLGRMDEANQVLDAFYEYPEVADTEGPASATLLRYLIECAVLTGHRSMIEAVLGRLKDLASIVFSEAWMPSCLAARLGEASLLMGDTKEARRYFEQAVQVCTEVRFRPELALSRLGLAELLLDHYPDEHDAAIVHLDFAIAELRDMKMQPALERALGRRGLLKA